MGAGQELVEASCTQCHGLNLIANYWGDTEEGWRKLFSSMVELPEDQAGTMASYLAEHFPVKPAPEAVVIPGDSNVEIREWLLPSLGSRPHDPLAAGDGSVWWTGQWSSVLGRLEPTTGVMKEFPLPPDSGPHGLAEDATGNVWYTGISRNEIGKLDPTTGEVTQYPISQEGARGPHTPIFDQDGTLWFTLQSGMVGRLVPDTGEMTIVSTPTENTYPYGIVVSSSGVPWYVDFRGNRLGSVDPDTMEVREYVLPNADARPRRIAITPDAVLWYTDYARGYLARFDPATGEVEEWASPRTGVPAEQGGRGDTYARALNYCILLGWSLDFADFHGRVMHPATVLVPDSDAAATPYDLSLSLVPPHDHPGRPELRRKLHLNPLSTSIDDGQDGPTRDEHQGHRARPRVRVHVSVGRRDPRLFLGCRRLGGCRLGQEQKGHRHAERA